MQVWHAAERPELVVAEVKLHQGACSDAGQRSSQVVVTDSELLHKMATMRHSLLEGLPACREASHMKLKACKATCMGQARAARPTIQ